MLLTFQNRITTTKNLYSSHTHTCEELSSNEYVEEPWPSEQTTRHKQRKNKNRSLRRMISMSYAQEIIGIKT